MPVYSPRIRERFIPVLYRLGRQRCRPMTALVEEALDEYLARRGITAPPAVQDSAGAGLHVSSETTATGRAA